ncbi:hypothetical protein A3Q56_03917 [Intoshia linei]|uniref:Fork-head domain-containing protein n=1 Tax=Intoshia linei TaxID=1819745 RepID=A0A177B420_9BILA|nr:hypothetical protein A3Q56_03917 [Intoshia linei]
MNPKSGNLSGEIGHELETKKCRDFKETIKILGKNKTKIYTLCKRKSCSPIRRDIETLQTTQSNYKIIKISPEVVIKTKKQKPTRRASEPQELSDMSWMYSFRPATLITNQDDNELFRDPKTHRKPDLTYSNLICLALYLNESNKLQIKDICKWIEKNFVYFSQPKKRISLHNSIRHNLTSNDYFERSKPFNYTGSSFWYLNSLHDPPPIPPHYLKKFKLNHMIKPQLEPSLNDKVYQYYDISRNENFDNDVVHEDCTIDISKDADNVLQISNKECSINEKVITVDQNEIIIVNNEIQPETECISQNKLSFSLKKDENVINKR